MMNHAILNINLNTDIDNPLISIELIINLIVNLYTDKREICQHGLRKLELSTFWFKCMIKCNKFSFYLRF